MSRRVYRIVVAIEVTVRTQNSTSHDVEDGASVGVIVIDVVVENDMRLEARGQ